MTGRFERLEIAAVRRHSFSARLRAPKDERGSFIIEFALGSWVYFGILIFFSWAIYFVYEQIALQYSIDKTVRGIAITGMDPVKYNTAAKQVTQLKTLIANASRNFHVDTNAIAVSMEWCDPVVDCSPGAWTSGVGGVNHWLRVHVSVDRRLPFLGYQIPFKTGVLVRNEPRPGS